MSASLSEGESFVETVKSISELGLPGSDTEVKDRHSSASGEVRTERSKSPGHSEHSAVSIQRHSKRSAVSSTKSRPTSGKVNQLDVDKSKQSYSASFVKSNSTGHSKRTQGQDDKLSDPTLGLNGASDSYSKQLQGQGGRRKERLGTSGSASDLEDSLLRLSQDDLRYKLFHSFKSKGVLNTVKSQLRNRLAASLQNGALLERVSEQNSTWRDGSLFLQLANSLVADHLRRCNFEYTLSVFQPESMTTGDKQLSIKDILQVLRISPQSKFYERLEGLSKLDNSKGFLWHFLTEISASHCKTTDDATTQTEDVHSFTEGNLERKLLAVEEEVLRKAVSDLKSDSVSVEARMLAYQRKYEAEKRAELKAEMERFRNKELATMRLQEREAGRKEIENLRRSMDREYKNKMDSLKEREAEITESLHKQRKILDDQGYEQRQKILQEMQILKERENEMKRNHELSMKSVALDEERNRAMTDQLKAKELSLKAIEERYESRLKDEVLRIKIEMQEEQRKQEEIFRIREQQLKDDKTNFESQKGAYTNLVDDIEKQKQIISQLQANLLAAKQSSSSLRQKYENATERLREVGDYGRVKERLVVSQKEIEQLRTRLNEVLEEKQQRQKEHREMVNDLVQRISQPSPQLEVLRNEIDKEKQDYMENKQNMKYRIDDLEARLHSEVSKNKDLNKLHNEQLLRQREMAREVEELKLALRKAHKVAQHRSGIIAAEKRIAERTPEKLASPLREQISSPSNVFNKSSRKSLRKRLVDEESKDMTTLDFIGDSKEIFAKLEKEAAELEKSYKEFQDRQRQLNDPVRRKQNTSRSGYDFIALAQYNSDTSPILTRSKPRWRNEFELEGDIPERETDAFDRRSDFGSLVTRTSEQSRPRLPSPVDTQVLTSSRVSHPLSSTQAPGGSDAPSIGLSVLSAQHASNNPRRGTAEDQRDFVLRNGPLHMSELEAQNEQDARLRSLLTKMSGVAENRPHDANTRQYQNSGGELAARVPEEGNIDLRSRSTNNEVTRPEKSYVTNALPNYVQTTSHPTHGNQINREGSSGLALSEETCHSLTQVPLPDSGLAGMESVSNGVASATGYTTLPVYPSSLIHRNGTLPPLSEHSLNETTLEGHVKYESPTHVDDRNAVPPNGTREIEAYSASAVRHASGDFDDELGLRETSLTAVFSPTKENMEDHDSFHSRVPTRVSEPYQATDRFQALSLDDTWRSAQALGHDDHHATVRETVSNNRHDDSKGDRYVNESNSKNADTINLEGEKPLSPPAPVFSRENVAEQREKQEREKREKQEAFERERAELERLEKEELEAQDQRSDNASLKQSSESSLKVDNNVKSEGEISQNAPADEKNEPEINPVMQQYMQMVLQRRQQEAEQSNVNKESSVKEFDADEKINDVSSRSDVSGLIEGELGSVHGDSDDDFDWG